MTKRLPGLCDVCGEPIKGRKDRTTPISFEPGMIVSHVHGECFEKYVRPVIDGHGNVLPTNMPRPPLASG